MNSFDMTNPSGLELVGSYLCQAFGNYFCSSQTVSISIIGSAARSPLLCGIRTDTHFRHMPTRPKTDVVAKFTKKSGLLPVAATLGSSVRAKGILLEVRAHLPSDTKS